MLSLLDALEELFERHGYYGDRTMNLVMPGIDGLQKMKALMARLRERPLSEIAGTKVLFALDYSTGIKTELGTGREETMELSGSNVLRYELEDHTSFIVRPSGTEPKIKVYLLTKAESAAEGQEKIRRYAAFAETLQ